MASVLVTGGAGYIGSHMVKALLEAGYRVVTLDDLSGGYRDAVVGGDFLQGDIGDTALVRELLGRYQVSAVMHFASFIQVGESVTNPAKYYDNNVARTVRLLGAMQRCGVLKFIFSSSAAVYGEPLQVPIPETHPLVPVNPYGRSKLMVEQMLADFDRAYSLRSVSLRYFNAAGADPAASLGERHEPETHLIPLVLKAASGSLPDIKVFGRDYDTPDGTCVRDYVHIADLCQAHLLALERLLDGGTTVTCNLGNGQRFLGSGSDCRGGTCHKTSNSRHRRSPPGRRSGAPGGRRRACPCAPGLATSLPRPGNHPGACLGMGNKGIASRLRWSRTAVLRCITSE